MRVRKKPVEVEIEGPLSEEQVVETMEGELTASPGDYIVTGVEGERYPIDPEVLLETYEPVCSDAEDEFEDLERLADLEVA